MQTYKTIGYVGVFFFFSTHRFYMCAKFKLSLVSLCSASARSCSALRDSKTRPQMCMFDP